MEIYYILFKPCTQQIQSVPLNFKERGLRAIEIKLHIIQDMINHFNFPCPSMAIIVKMLNTFFYFPQSDKNKIVQKENTPTLKHCWC